VKQRAVVILGSTGSIGRQALDVITAHPGRWNVLGLVAGTDEHALRRQVDETGTRHSGLGEDAAVDLAALPEADVVLNAIVGAAGLRASVAALEAGKVLALANKESLVAGGEICLQAARRGHGSIVPVDSEHAAIGQCLEARVGESVKRIVLTASGGPFLNRKDLTDVTPSEALAHPTWSMGPKITVDCATMMNKGLEVIEAHHLFGVDYERVDVLVHPQSTVHGIVEFVDGSMLMQAAPTDMRIPIQAALSHPALLQSPFEKVDLSRVGALQFEELDLDRWPCIGLAYEAGRRGQTYPAVLNAANEEAVGRFLANELPFAAIPSVVEQVLLRHDGVDASSLEAVFAADEWARAEANTVMGTGSIDAAPAVRT
jgi:1-deoxy-D-xylulose-5-phosphate reductoisomerase